METVTPRRSNDPSPGNAVRPLLTSRDLGAAIAAARKERGWSQSTLAGEAGVARPWLSSFENGKPTVSLDGVLRVTIALGLGFGLVPADADADGSTGIGIESGRFDLNLYIDDWGTSRSASEPSAVHHD
ncbi:helix-turn-helix transcriptional regulator [Candidatus Poriferisodalis sp.]|uniref:helix-turn-helix transcriptional regulator n=1 Tax=Candidatus Poriferisodalis sp. TaxID=3101277 RepID=UPI003B520EE2